MLATHTPTRRRQETEHATIRVPLRDGVVLVGSDGHFWPGTPPSAAWRAFLRFTRTLRPRLVVMNGDAFDGARISRHPPIGWEHQPTVLDELQEVQKRLGDVQKAARRGTRFIWPLGNHDARFNTRLASVASEYRGVFGTRLVHHFPEWEPCWALEVGGREGAVIKHRYKGGTHAAHNNALWAGRSVVTGHTHALKITSYTDYNGCRWGIECGTLARTDGPQFNYAERNPVNQLSGFVVLTFSRGRLLPPEAVYVLSEREGLVFWRGETLKV